MGPEPIETDLLTSIPGVEFDVAWERRIVAVIDPRRDQQPNFATHQISALNLYGVIVGTARYLLGNRSRYATFSSDGATIVVAIDINTTIA